MSLWINDPLLNTHSEITDVVTHIIHHVERVGKTIYSGT